MHYHDASQMKSLLSKIGFYSAKRLAIEKILLLDHGCDCETNNPPKKPDKNLRGTTDYAIGTGGRPIGSEGFGFSAIGGMSSFQSGWLHKKRIKHAAPSYLLMKYSSCRRGILPRWYRGWKPLPQKNIQLHWKSEIIFLSFRETCPDRFLAGSRSPVTSDSYKFSGFRFSPE
jgi:hypothetical protein